MATDIVLRSIKAAALTHAEMDQNWESLAQTIDSQTSSYTVLVTDQNKIIEANISSGTITLPTVANAAGTDTDSFKITVKNIHATSLGVVGNGGELIDGFGGVTLLTNECVTLSLSANAAEWTIIAVHGPNLTGITATSTEINYNDITTLGTAQANKVMTTDGANNFTSNATVQATQITGTTVHASTTLQLGGVNITASAAELNTMNGILSSTAELNTMNGILASTAELNTMNGILSSTTELNYSNNVTSDIQTQLDARMVRASNLGDLTSLSTARTNLGVDVAGTDNSTDVALLGTPNYITLSGQFITRALINLTSHITGILPIANGGTASSTATGAVTNLGFSATASEVNAICDGRTLTSSDDKIDNFPATTQMLFRTTAAPTGWTKLTTHNDKALRIVSGTIGSGGTQAFTTTFGSGKTTDSHTLLISEMPAHTHSTSSHASLASSGTQTTSSTSSTQTGSTGGDGGHTHPLTNFDLQYVDTIEATKD